ncbi:LAQU0S01e13322g1_1 [Lachancea quebecensis]|uniref:LAQU0S01e13322g1_1 n=1 Tax=Lachancea quebecensis TaxID=1654605 RepID=A0A0P1KMV1_9SACH|nr:LAQU0S01e13322g1_1 [Lachancea quebecensis]
MAFLKKKLANVNHSSRSRSGSTSSSRFHASPSTPNSPEFKLPELPPKHAAEKNSLKTTSFHSQSHAITGAVPRSLDEKTDIQSSSGFTFEESQANEARLQEAKSPSKKNSAGKNAPSSLSSNNATGSTYTGITNPPQQELLFSWDVTNPDEWNMVRVLSWLRFNDFDDSWVAYFRKRQIHGHSFLKLMAYDNFLEHENYLAQTKTSSYKRFQYLLKRTLEQNVVSGHIRNRSDKSNGSRSSSDSVKIRNKKRQDFEHSRSISETMVAQNKSSSLDVNDEKIVPSRSHQKTSSASSLYRRSFISLLGNSNQGQSKPDPNINIKIPPRPVSSAESPSQPDRCNNRTCSSPISPGYSGIFRRQHKSSSSESSIFNTLFGSNTGGSSNSIAEQPSEEKKKPRPQKSSSLESLPREKPSTNSSEHLLPNNSYPLNDEKSRLWGKLKRKSLQPDLAATRSTSAPSEIELSEEKTLVNTKLPGSQEFNWENFVLEKRFYPLKNSKTDDRFILITKDNKSFIPLNVGIITNLEELKDSMALTLEIKHKNYTIHLTDFGCDIGCAIEDDLLETLRGNMFSNVPRKLYIKDQSPIQPKPEIGAPSNEVAAPRHPVKNKGSEVSANSSIINSNDDTSTITSCSDVTSFDDIAHAAGRAVYPQTPNSYYGAVVTNPNSDVDYWTVKDNFQEDSLQSRSSNNRQKFRPRKSSGTDAANVPPNTTNFDQSFQIIRKKSEDEIDFNNRRASPYVNPDFAPRREAPKPPSSSQNSLGSTGSNNITNSPKFNRMRSNTASLKRKARPPPPASILNQLSNRSSNGSLRGPKNTAVSPSESVVHSYTPGSTQVLVPQPYKGKSDSMKPGILNDSVVSSISQSFVSRSGSLQSITNSVLPSPPHLCKRVSTKRIVSSASAADIFDENDISFADAPNLTDSEEDRHSDSSDEIIWSSQRNKCEPSKLDGGKGNSQGSDCYVDENSLSSIDSMTNVHGHFPTRKMTLRPSPEVVYQNLERFFPGTDLDRPIVEGTTPPPSPRIVKASSPDLSSRINGPLSSDPEPRSPNNSRVGTPQTMISKSMNDSQEVLSQTSNALKVPRRTKTIRIIAREASDARRNSKTRSFGRKNTKMWGTRVVEVTDKKTVAINKSKNSNGEYKEFAWIKGEMIGKGSFGSVYLGLNVTTGEMVAVKQVEVPRYGSQDETTLSVLEALKSEVSTLKDLDHVNIVQYLGFENKNHVYSLFLEYVAGGSVGSLIRLFGRFDEDLIRFLAVQVLRGLAYLHSKGILHRDMKADNLLLDVDGICKISDFGISKKSNNIYSNSDMTMRGTVFWMAPEMVDTKQGYSAKVDIWSLGCVVLEMFAGKRPWSNFEVVAAMFKIGKFKSAPPIPEDTQKLLSAEAKNFLDACFEIDPEKRPTADELLSHPFCQVSSKFAFPETSLAQFIRSKPA